MKDGGISIAMAARLLGAVAAAVACAIALCRALRSERNAPHDSPILRRIVVALSAFWMVAWIVIAAARFRFPFELEWIGGGMKDHTARWLQGLSVYAAPGPDWIPTMYPPLYYWVCGTVARAAGGLTFQSMRFVSIGGTVVSAALMVVWIRRCGGARSDWRFWSVAALGALFAAYRMTGAWYDIERNDMLFLALCLAGAVAVEYAGTRLEGAVVGAGAGVAFTCAFLTRPQALAFVAAACLGLALRGRWAAFAAVAIVSVAGCLGSSLWLNASTGGWFVFYAFEQPARLGMMPRLAAHFLFVDMPLLAPTIVLAVVAIRWSPATSEDGSPPGSFVVLVPMVAAALLVSFVSRARWGGDQNVLIPSYVLLATAACAGAARLCHTTSAARRTLYALVLAQMLVLTYRPDAQIPTAANRSAGAAYADTIRRLEREGSVLSIDHGGFTATPKLHMLWARDYLAAGNQPPPSFVEALSNRRYAAIVTDQYPQPSGTILDSILLYYKPTECRDLTTTWCVTGFLTPSRERPVWILRPRLR